MKTQIENSIGRIAEQARGRFFALLNGARNQTENAAGKVSKGKGPVKTVSKMSLKLSAVSHKTADKVLKQQTRMVEHQIDAIASRLHAAATATDVRDLVSTQIRLIPENASRFASDARDTLGIVASAGQEVGKLLKGTVAELRGKAQPKQTAKKTVKKAASKKATAKKAPAKKVAAPKTVDVASDQKAA
jgi:phasin family protein